MQRSAHYTVHLLLFRENKTFSVCSRAVPVMVFVAQFIKKFTKFERFRRLMEPEIFRTSTHGRLIMTEAGWKTNETGQD